MSNPTLPILPRRLRRARRRLARWLKPHPAQLVYHPRYDASFASVPNDHLRAERILAFLASEGLVSRHGVHRPNPASLAQLARVHTAAYLDRLHDTATLGRTMGGDVSLDQVDRLLDLQRLNVGGTVLAAHLARRRRTVVAHLGGGLHHAHADHGEGFCVLNDVAVAIDSLRRHGLKQTVLVIDLDLHDGNGTRSLFADDESVHTLSVHATDWGPTDAVASTSVALGAAVDDGTYAACLDDLIPRIVQEVEPALVFYLAGTDPAHDDPLGDWRISDHALLERDRRVYGAVRGHRNLPLVILLAGGYGTGAWRHSARFLGLVFGNGRRTIEPPSTEDIAVKRYRHIVRLLGRDEAPTPDEPFRLSEADLIPPGWGMVKETRLLGQFGKHGIELLLERSGLLGRLRDLGFRSPVLTLHLDDPAGHTVRVCADDRGQELLAELRLSIDRRSVSPLALLSVDWLLLQNPRAAFVPGRSRLPGQQHPGLGMANDVLAMLVLAAERLHLDGIAYAPSHFHVAAPWRDRLVFADPAAGRRFEDLVELFRDLPLADASRALAEGRVVDPTGVRVRWQPGPMVMPMSDAAVAWVKTQRRVIEDLPSTTLRLRDDPDPGNAGRSDMLPT